MDMNKIKVNTPGDKTAGVRVGQQKAATVGETLLERYPEIAEGVEKAFDIIDDASWASFPASDAPGWISLQVGS
jgi:hypothetical protein